MARALLVAGLAAQALLAGCARNHSVSGHDRGSLADLSRVVEGRTFDGKADASPNADHGRCGASACELDGTCVQEGKADSTNACRICDPGFSRRTWGPAPGCVITLAGSAQGFADGPGSAARFNNPEDLFVEGPSRVVVVDSDNHRVRRIQDGVVTTLAGDGTPGYADGPTASAMFFTPHGIGMDATGQILVADARGHRVRGISGGQVTTIAGDGVAGRLDGPALKARFEDPMDVAADGGKIYVADKTTVRVIEAGTVSTLAGDGTVGLLNGPAKTARFGWTYAIVVTSAGRIYVTDQANHAIRVIFGGMVTTLCGTGQQGHTDGPATTAILGFPEGLAVDGSGTVYFSEHATPSIRRVASNTVSTIAGSSPAAFVDGPLAAARFSMPTGVGLDSAGRIYVADSDNHRIRVIRLP